MFRIYDGRNEFYQWDLERKLIVKDHTITEVHFCNKTDNCALVCEVYTEGANRVVDVPNILLQTVWRIRAYAYTDNHTEFERFFDIKPRTKPADYIYTETEVKRYETFEERLAALEEKEVDLTGYATEEFVESAISDNAPDWNADGYTTGQIKGAIANRTHYSKAIFKTGIYEDVEVGVTEIIDLTDTYYKSYVKYLNKDTQSDKYNAYPLTVYLKYRNKAGKENSLTQKLTTAKLIDTTNLSLSALTGFTLYFILDTTVLSAELKALFPKNGIYYYVTANKETSNFWFTQVEVELRHYQKKLDYGFLPAQFLEAADKEEIMAAIGNVGGADWAQNDESAKDYIKNRTHYEETVNKEITIRTNFTEITHGAEVVEDVLNQRASAKYTVSGKDCVYLRDGSGDVKFIIGDGVNEYKAKLFNKGETIVFSNSANMAVEAYITYTKKVVVTHKLETKYLPDELTSPLLLDASLSDYYGGNYEMGDAALEAIKTGRQILVKVPNADGQNFTAIYSPVYMYQVPNYENQYLYLFYLKDEKQNIDLSALGMGVIQIPLYGELMMLLSKKYNKNPLITE